jgi:hypothetical protein
VRVSYDDDDNKREALHHHRPAWSKWERRGSMRNWNDIAWQFESVHIINFDKSVLLCSFPLQNIDFSFHLSHFSIAPNLWGKREWLHAHTHTHTHGSVRVKLFLPFILIVIVDPYWNYMLSPEHDVSFLLFFFDRGKLCVLKWTYGKMSGKCLGCNNTNCVE